MQDTMRRQGLATIEEAATFLASGRTTVYALMTAGELPFVKIGRARRIKWAALEEYVDRLSATAAGGTAA